MFRAIVLLAGVLLFAMGCGSARSGPTTPYEHEGIEATLPGDDWERESLEEVGRFSVDTWKNGDGSLMFRVAFDPEEVVNPPRVHTTTVEEYMSLVGYPQISTTNRDMLYGHRGLRLESYPQEAGDFHMVEYALVAAFRHYFIGAGAKQAIWDSGGRDKVDAILSSVKVLDD